MYSDTQTRIEMYTNSDATYQYVYHCQAEPFRQKSDPNWKIQRLTYLLSDSSFVRRSFPINPSTLKADNGFVFSATNLSTVQSLSYYEL